MTMRALRSSRPELPILVVARQHRHSSVDVVVESKRLNRKLLVHRLELREIEQCLYQQEARCRAVGVVLDEEKEEPVSVALAPRTHMKFELYKRQEEI